MAVRWSETQERAVRQWRWIHDNIGRRKAVAVVAELNELGALCELAAQAAGGEERRCRHCVVFDDAGQCADTRLHISGLVLAGETAEARAATMALLRRIAAATAPELC